MKDIDFDELDKAVNSLMGGVKRKTDGAEAKTLTIATTLKEGEQPAYDKIRHAAEKIGSETLLSPTEKTAVLSGTADEDVKVLSLSDKPLEPIVFEGANTSLPSLTTVVTPPVPPEPATPKPQVVKGPSGRFMDVMHPSSDMTSAPKNAPVAASPTALPVNQASATSLVVPTREPRSATIAPQVVVEAEVTPLVAPVPSVVPQIDTPAIVVEQEQVTQPIESPAPAETIVQTAPALPVFSPAPVEISPPVPVVVSKSIPVPSTMPTTEAIEPLSSPFLPDAKVEKRPLGGAVDVSFDETDISDFDTRYMTDNSADTQLAPPVQVNRPTVPDELHSDLLSIETSLAETVESKSTASSSESPAVSSTQGTAQSDTPADGAIFDTTAYSKTVDHPKKHTSEWIWIAVIVGIILVCAAGAAAFYLLSAQ